MSRSAIVAAVIVLLSAGTLVLGQTKKGSAKRSPPPKFDPAKSASIFFENAFERVTGERPKSFRGSTSKPDASAKPANLNEGGSSSGAYAWSKLVSATTLEDEVKALKSSLDKNISTPSDFAGRAHKPVRRDLSTLAMLFGVVSEYDSEVRWKKDAPVVRDLMARTASNAKAGGNTQVYNEAKLRKTELGDLLTGNAPTGRTAEPKTVWAEVCDRAPLMQRLEAGFDGKLAPLTANKENFSKNKDVIRHEAEMTVVISEVLAREGMDDADADAYRGFATAMKAAAQAIVEAVKSDNADLARQASGTITKVCSDCHQIYRG